MADGLNANIVDGDRAPEQNFLNSPCYKNATYISISNLRYY